MDSSYSKLPETTASEQLSFRPESSGQERTDSAAIAHFAQSQREVRGVDDLQRSMPDPSVDPWKMREDEKTKDRTDLNKLLSEFEEYAKELSPETPTNKLPVDPGPSNRGNQDSFRSSLHMDISPKTIPHHVENKETGEDTANPEKPLLESTSPKPSSSTEESQKPQRATKEQVTNALAKLDPKAIDDLREQLRDLPIPPEIAATKTGETLKKLAQEGLEILNELTVDKQGKLTCIRPSQLFCQLGWELPVFALAYASAVVNLTVFVADSYENGVTREALVKTITALGASLASGTMYLKGTVNILDRLEEWNKSRVESGKPFPRASMESIGSFLAGFKDPDTAIKRVTFGIITGFSVLLDAKNSALGITKLTGSKVIGTIVGIFNGISEGLVPLTDLEATWQCIFHPMKALWRGSIFTEKELYEKAKYFLGIAYNQSPDDVCRTPSEMLPKPSIDQDLTLPEPGQTTKSETASEPFTGLRQRQKITSDELQIMLEEDFQDRKQTSKNVQRPIGSLPKQDKPLGEDAPPPFRTSIKT